MRRRFSNFSLIVTMAYVIFPENAHAYIDPGTGSMALQILLAGIVGALFTIKTYWRKAKEFVVGFFRKPGSPL